MAGQVRLNHGGMAQLLRSAGIRADLQRRGEAVASAARAAAPVATGAYRASITAESDTTDRAVCRVKADVPYALIVEVRLRVLGRALDAARG